MTGPHDEQDLPEAKALAALSAEMRERELPEPDFDAMEAVVMGRISREITLNGRESLPGLGNQTASGTFEPPPKPRPSGKVLVALFAATLAVAAAFGIYVSRSSEPAPAPSAVASAETQRPAPPTHVETGASPATFAREGLASWTVEANSRAEVTDEGERIVVRLDAGAVTVDVVPQKVVERFVVIAGSTRVAVHGTKFRVSRDGEVKVEVERGVVMVGRVGETGTYRLTAGASETFSLEGKKVTELDPVLVAPRAPAAKKVAEKPVLDDATIRARATSVATDCFRESARRIGPNVHLTVETTLTLTTGDRVAATFDPPVSPTVAECVRGSLGELRSKEPRTIVVPLSLAARP